MEARTKKSILTISVVAVFAVLSTISLSALLTPQEAFAPSGSRGYYCEWSTMNGWAHASMPFAYMPATTI